MWILFLLVTAGVIAVFVWDYRRKAARREAASKERLEQIFKTKAGAMPPDASPAAVSSIATAPVSKAPAGAPAFPARERFLGHPETLVYLLLKTGIPDHQIFANVTLASVISVPGVGFDREQQLRRLSTYLFDFVVCDRNMRIVAVLDMEAPGSADTSGMERYKSDCLMAAGVRLVRINPMSLPSRDAIRGLICGAPDAAGS